MSRSKKKNPYVSFVCTGRGSMKKWKKTCNSEIREYLKNPEKELSFGLIRKFTNRWTAPDDGKQYYNEPQGYRK